MGLEQLSFNFDQKFWEVPCINNKVVNYKELTKLGMLASVIHYCEKHGTTRNI